LPRYQRDAIGSFLLISEWTTGAEKLTVTLVEMQPGGIQHEHSHAPEQSYCVLEGTGLMSVDGEEAVVEPGDCVFIPSGCAHGLVNTGISVLKYLSVAAPSFGKEQSQKLWPLASVRQMKASAAG